MKLFSICQTCNQRRFIVKNQKIMLPIKEVATSKKLMCNKCAGIVQKAVNMNKPNG